MPDMQTKRYQELPNYKLVPIEALRRQEQAFRKCALPNILEQARRKREGVAHILNLNVIFD